MDTKHFTFRVLSTIKVNGKIWKPDELVVLDEDTGDQLRESGHVSLDSDTPVAADAKPKAAKKKVAK